jgi:hypothetical protein
VKETISEIRVRLEKRMVCWFESEKVTGQIRWFMLGTRTGKSSLNCEFWELNWISLGSISVPTAVLDAE